MIKRSIYIFLIAFLMPVFSFGQKNWSLDQCLQYTLSNNLNVQNVLLNRRSQQISLFQARLNRLPQVSSQAGITESSGRSIDPATNTYSNINNFSNSYGISATLNLFEGFAQRNKIEFEYYNLCAENNRVEQQKNKAASAVVDAFYNLQLQEQLFVLYSENLKLMQRELYSMGKFIQVGRKAGSDIYEFEAKLANDSFLMIQQSGNVDRARLNLKLSMNFPVTDTLRLDTFSLFLSFFPDTLHYNNFLNRAEQHLPDLKITQFQVLAAKKHMNQVRGSFWPSLEAYAGWYTNYYQTSGVSPIPFHEQFKYNAGEYAALQLTIPLFNRLNRINALRTAKLEYLKASNIYQKQIQELEKLVTEAYVGWQSAIHEYAAARKQLVKSRIAFRTAEKKMTFGQITVIDFYIQKNELLKARAELVRTFLQFGLKEKYILFFLNGTWLNRSMVPVS